MTIRLSIRLSFAFVMTLLFGIAGCGEVKGGACEVPMATCSETCVDTLTDPLNCGACGRACASDETCAAGQCTLQCNGGTTSCSGACVNTKNDPAHCGGCDRPCASGMCSNGTCMMAGYFVLTGTPDPASVFNTIVETYRFPNNLTNSIWNRASNTILTGEFSQSGYWAFAQGTATYANAPDNGTDVHARMVQIPATNTVIYSRSASSDGVGPATSAQFVVATLNPGTGRLVGDASAVFSDGFTAGCRLTSASATELLCYDGTGIRRYKTAANSPTLTFAGTVALSAALPTTAQCAPMTPCYGSTFAFDGAFYYFALQQGSPNNLVYVVYNVAGTLVGQMTASGAGAMNGLYFDWSVGRYSSHDGFGGRVGGTVFGTGSDTHCFGPVSPAHMLQ
jgi:hypothetical protein